MNDMVESGKSMIEIGGIKMEVDLRSAKRIEHYKVGDAVKVLTKTYSSAYKSSPGIIVGFDAFKELPTILIAYLELEYASAEMKMLYLNSQSEGVEICQANENELNLDKDSALELFERKIQQKKHELDDLCNQKNYFENKFGQVYKNAD